MELPMAIPDESAFRADPHVAASVGEQLVKVTWRDSILFVVMNEPAIFQLVHTEFARSNPDVSLEIAGNRKGIVRAWAMRVMVGNYLPVLELP